MVHFDSKLAIDLPVDVTNKLRVPSQSLQILHAFTNEFLVAEADPCQKLNACDSMQPCHHTGSYERITHRLSPLRSRGFNYDNFVV